MPRNAPDAPTREEVLRFVQGPGAEMRRRELVEALAAEHGHRTAVREILRDLLREGAIGRRRRPDPRRRGEAGPPRVTVLDVIGIDGEGDLRLAHPGGEGLAALLPAENLEGGAPGVGDRVLVRLRPGPEPDGPLQARERLRGFLRRSPNS